MEWTTGDLAALATRGIPVEEVERQLALLVKPRKSIELMRPATAGDGIRVVPETEIDRWSAVADETARAGRVTKFVPASGAATRMFRDLAPALDPSEPIGEAARRFVAEIESYPFYQELRSLVADREVASGTEAADDQNREILRLLLSDEGLGYGRLAKGLIPFHRYGKEARTAFEEQLREGALYASDGRVARFHFTVPERDLQRFTVAAAEHAGRILEEMGIGIDATFSIQHPATDTIAVTPEGDPFRDEDGALLFRPGGHGALLRNLDEIGGDLVFIKNIDNIRPDPHQKSIARWYRVLIGYLADLERRVFGALRSLGRGDVDALRDAAEIATDLHRPWQGDPGDHEGMTRHLLEALSRPIRVCAAVRNEGEPGGAPFWVRDHSGRESLQIVERSQVDASNREQTEIFRSATHFNPVAIACSVRNPEGMPYDLREFVDETAAFVASKSHHGRELRALEHPGLWNGAMAGWSSVFVELPAFTFAPVKSVFDLLREEHRTGES